ncbi:MAG: NUDIX hydrolase [Desulfuromonas sp.]|nr:MAG: NUDIX hydrolase [Desulfuromonas sp.]
MEHPRHIIVASCLVRNQKGEILLVRHHRRGWELPQGRIEEGEELLAGLHREVREETGVSIATPELAAIWSKCSPPTALIFGFIADYLSGEITASAETPDVAWCRPDTAAARIEHPINRDRLQELLDHSGPLRYLSYTTGPYRLTRNY